MTKINIAIEQDEGSGMWIATATHPPFTTAAPTIDKLFAKLPDVYVDAIMQDGKDPWARYD